MAKVLIFSSPLCGYCHMAKRLLKQKDVEFEDVNVLGNSARRTEMETLSQRRTVPQIFINKQHVGGFDDLYALEKSGKLDDLLAANVT